MVTGPGMADELQHLHRTNAAGSNTGWFEKSEPINNIILILAKIFIFNLQSLETMRMPRTFVKHHSTVEKYMASTN